MRLLIGGELLFEMIEELDELLALEGCVDVADRLPWRKGTQIGNESAALMQAESRSETSAYPSWWDYTAGALQAALGKKQEAEQSFRKALLLPDRMLAYHMTRLARSEATP
jgi:hypothetical protein